MKSTSVFLRLRYASINILVSTLISIAERLFCLLLRMLRKREGGQHLVTSTFRLTETPSTKDWAYNYVTSYIYIEHERQCFKHCEAEVTKKSNRQNLSVLIKSGYPSQL